MSREEENLVTWLLLVIGFLGIVWWGSVSMDFQKSCESSCGDVTAITPFMDFQEVCLCDEGNGKWRRVLSL